ncbi:hypothetical protein EF847_19555 [Actinobacteria bacterium YIM 96077]|uniref:Uncharacterized protein n=1 Tax=Phytoactinopolyspora halophila TaxID=1981511 RepID=A0A329QQU0_9ACTN|nr:hypothetical protein [Phytoactinopolyspora halophila]AYY14563.1 hypothetical protein EF847_19555 [Actinobacteria bacterium YIM 96077]RAW14059.1 hypothetical protein DPM12_11580 [Phytoactinopolyspora halophila]
MPISSRLRLGQDIHAVVRLELFVVAAVSAILATRGYLILMDYPQLGSDGLHIAHMLWGGLLMLVSHVLLLGFIGPRVKELAAFLGGVGFGLFIDEVGKFVTADNDYFFQPSFAIMYVIFVALVLVMHWMSERPRHNPATDLANATVIAAAGQLRGLNHVARTEARQLVDAARTHGANDRAVAAVQELIEASPAARHRAGRYAALRQHVLRVVRTIVRSRAAYVAVGAVLAIQAIDPLVDLFRIFLDQDYGNITTIRVIRLGWALLTTGVIVAGFLYWRRDQQRGLRAFRYAVLFNILIGQVFNFAVRELDALPGVVVNLVALAVLNYRLRLLENPPPEPAGVEPPDVTPHERASGTSSSAPGPPVSDR